jgi:hypothetical protein
MNDVKVYTTRGGYSFLWHITGLGDLRLIHPQGIIQFMLDWDFLIECGGKRLKYNPVVRKRDVDKKEYRGIGLGDITPHGAVCSCPF